jgi:ammonia channel protein AmtB
MPGGCVVEIPSGFAALAGSLVIGLGGEEGQEEGAAGGDDIETSTQRMSQFIQKNNNKMPHNIPL